MKLFLKIIAILFLIGFAWFWMMAEFFGYGVGYIIDSKRSWNEVKGLPVVAAMGHWNKIPYQKSFPLKSEVFPQDINKAEWVKVVEASGFNVTEENDQCDVSIYAVDFLQKYDTCAWRVVGPLNCSYSYYVAANFENNKLSEVVGTRGNFICW